MRIKSYFAPTVAAAIGSARHELGPEAVLVNSRRSPAECRHLGEYEVVFGLLPGSKMNQSPEASQPCDGKPDNGADGSDARVWEEFRSLHDQLAEIRRLVAAEKKSAADGSGVFGRLIASEIAPTLAAEIESRLKERRQPRETGGDQSRKALELVDSADRLLAAALAERFETSPVLGCPGSPAVAAFVGPPGTGKTTTIMKLAVQYGLAEGRAVRLISTDTQRVAAAQQLRTYAAVLDLEFREVEHWATLPDLLGGKAGDELVLIDTPGFAPADMEQASELAGVLNSCRDVDVHLVLDASTRAVDLSHAADRYAAFNPRKLLFTKLDEASCFGALISEAVRAGKPVSFLTAGQQVPEDIRPATREELAGLMLRPSRELAQPAA